MLPPRGGCRARRASSRRRGRSRRSPGRRWRCLPARPGSRGRRRQRTRRRRRRGSSRSRSRRSSGRPARRGRSESLRKRVRVSVEANGWSPAPTRELTVGGHDADGDAWQRRKEHVSRAHRGHGSGTSANAGDAPREKKICDMAFIQTSGRSTSTLQSLERYCPPGCPRGRRTSRAGRRGPRWAGLKDGTENSCG